MMRRAFWTLVLCVLLVAVMGRAAAAAPASSGPTTKPVVAVFRLTGEMAESPQDEFEALFGSPASGLRDVVERMRKAADDPNCKAVVIFAEDLSAGFGQTEELRQAMKRVRDAKKPVLVHSDSMKMREYVLLSGASRLSVVPTADLWVTGIFAEQPYLRQLLDKIHVKPDFMTCGAYKSAAELFMRDGPSKEADEMTNWLVDGIYATSVRLIADGRGVSTEKVTEWIDGGPYTAEKAREAGLVDVVEQRAEFEAYVKSSCGPEVTFDRKYGRPQKPKLDFSSPFAMFKIWGDMLAGPAKKAGGKPVVGVVYLEGPIMLGTAERSPFGSAGTARSSELRKALDKAANDDSVKAVVLRVNSPGGSAVASEIILDATRRVKAKKPLVVSMGDVAGSGGYYVTCAADTVFADEATITGSIGVVAGKLVTNEMWGKLGITFKPYQRGRYAGMLASDDGFTADERERMQAWMDEIYGTFKKHVTDIRGSRLKKPIDEIAGGRVYTGRQALDLGLIDRIGSLADACAHAAEEAKLSDYDVKVVPEQKNFMELIMADLMGEDDPDDDPARVRLTPQVCVAAGLADVAAPYLRQLDPERMAAVRAALERLELLEREGVAVAMPEYILK